MTEATQPANDSSWLKELYAHFEPVRREIEERGILEEEINADIHAAITAVRSGNADQLPSQQPDLHDGRV